MLYRRLGRGLHSLSTVQLLCIQWIKLEWQLKSDDVKLHFTLISLLSLLFSAAWNNHLNCSMFVKKYRNNKSSTLYSSRCRWDEMRSSKTLKMAAVYLEHRWRQATDSQLDGDEDMVDWWLEVRDKNVVQHRTVEQCQRVWLPRRHSVVGLHCMIPRPVYRQQSRHHHHHHHPHPHGCCCCCCCSPSPWLHGYDDVVHSQHSATHGNMTSSARGLKGDSGVGCCNLQGAPSPPARAIGD